MKMLNLTGINKYILKIFLFQFSLLFIGKNKEFFSLCTNICLTYVYHKFIAFSKWKDSIVCLYILSFKAFLRLLLYFVKS